MNFRKVSWTQQLLLVAVFSGAVAALFWPWLRPFHLPQRGGPQLTFRAGDLTPLFSVWNQITLRSILERGEFPLWSEHVFAGEPFFSKPQIGVLSLTTLFGLMAKLILGLSAGEAAQLVSTWTFLIHLVIAGLTVSVWVSRGDQSAVARFAGAAVAGLFFLMSGMMAEQAAIGHGPIVLAACWTPLILWTLHKAVCETRLLRWGVTCGLLLAVQLLAGGATVFLYSALAGAIYGLSWGFFATAESRRSLATRLGRLFLAGAVIGGVGFGLSSIKTLPGIDLMSISNRAGGLSKQVAAGRIVEIQEPGLILELSGTGSIRPSNLFAVSILLAAIGLIAAMTQRSRRWQSIAALCLILLGYLLSHSPITFGLFWDWVPVFRFQRIPQRALLLTYLGMTLLVGFGASQLVELVGKRSRIALAVLLPSLIGLESLIALPPLGPVADIRQEINANQMMKYLAALEGEFRIHAWESTDRNWGVEHVTVPSALENLTGWEHLWLLEYLGAEGTVGTEIIPFLNASYSFGNPPLFWGLMNVGYVSSTRPLSVAGLELLRQFPPCSSCQPRKSAGPYLYQNQLKMPRAYFVPEAIVVLGEPAERLLATYALLAHPTFDPKQNVIVQVEQLSEIEPGWPVRLVLLPRRHRNSQGANRLQYDRDRPGLWLDRERLGQALEESRSGGFRECRRSGERLENTGIWNVPRSAGWFVLAAKHAHFPGWEARLGNRRVPMLRANGVATAVALDGENTELRLGYAPRSFVLGAWLSTMSLVVISIILAGTAFGSRKLQPNNHDGQTNRN